MAKSEFLTTQQWTFSIHGFNLSQYQKFKLSSMHTKCVIIVYISMGHGFSRLHRYISIRSCPTSISIDQRPSLKNSLLLNMINRGRLRMIIPRVFGSLTRCQGCHYILEAWSFTKECLTPACYFLTCSFKVFLHPSTCHHNKFCTEFHIWLIWFVNLWDRQLLLTCTYSHTNPHWLLLAKIQHHLSESLIEHVREMLPVNLGYGNSIMQMISGRQVAYEISLSKLIYNPLLRLDTIIVPTGSIPGGPLLSNTHL